MGKSKEAVKEMKVIFKAQDDAEIAWAMKRGRDPLDPSIKNDMQLEEILQIRFWQAKDLFVDSIKPKPLTKTATRGSATPKGPPLWDHDVIARNKKFRLMSKEKMDKAVDSIELAISQAVDGFAKLSLSPKCYSWYNESCRFHRVSIMMSPTKDISRYVYIDDFDSMDATLYFGWINENDSDDDDYDPNDITRTCFIVFKGNDNQEHALILEELFILLEAQKNKENVFTYSDNTDYIFLYISNSYDKLFTVVLPGLDNIEFLVDDGEVEVAVNCTTEIDETDWETK